MIKPITLLSSLALITSALFSAEYATATSLSASLDDDSIERKSSVQVFRGQNAKTVPTPRARQKTSSKRTPTPRLLKVSNASVAALPNFPPTPRTKPANVTFAAPEYATGLLTGIDKKRYQRAFSALSKRNWKTALKEANKAGYELPAKYIMWAWLRTYKGGASFEEITSFMIDNPHWPYRSTLMRRAEEALINPISKERTLAWFTDRTPLTGMGMQRFAEALMADGQTAKGVEWIKKAWTDGNFSEGLEKKFLRAHRKLLSLKDHEARLDRLLWDRRAVDAIRMLDRVSKPQKSLAIARIRLMRLSKNVDAGIKQVPSDLMNDPGLLFDRAKWRRRKGKHEGAQELLLQAGADVPQPSKWWREREIQARKLLRRGHITDAYNLTSQHGMKNGGSFATAEWLSGWIALRFLREYDNALGHFTRLYENVSFPISKARGAYWLARTYDALKDRESASYWYEVASGYSTTFYGQVAMGKLGQSESREIRKKSSFSEQTRERLDKNELVLLVKHLAELGQEKRTRPFLMKLTEDASSPEEYVYFGQLANMIDRPDYSVSVAKRASQLGTELPDISWPTQSFAPRNPPIELPLILAITRQESAFAVDAVSRAGARGLMQLMPRTARSVSRKLKQSYSKGKLTTDPEYNMLLGSTYLSGLINNFDGSYILAIASYNAGSSRIRSWIRDWGDPRQGDINIIDWIELIPFSETRNYVQRVMENLQVYRQLLGEQNQQLVQIDMDLARGNSVTQKN